MYYISKLRSASFLVSNEKILVQYIRHIKKFNTMKNLKKTWFIQHPIDLEHKQYILLDFLKSVNKEIEKENIYYPVKKIFSMIKELSHVKCLLEEKDIIPSKYLTQSTRELLDIIKECNLSEDESNEALSILDSSLDILYKYADLGMDLWKNIENRIRTFEVTSEYSRSNDYGILILRNMATDEIIPYWWQSGKTNVGEKSIIMKQVPMLNCYFSLSYEFIIHEVIDYLKIDNKTQPRVTVMEISEDFNNNSVITKIAKELFMREMSQGATENE